MNCKECRLCTLDENGRTFCSFHREPIEVGINDECHYHPKFSVNLNENDFHYVLDGDLPHDFEVCLIIDRKGRLTACCWDTGLWSTANGAPGAFRQSRGCSIELDCVWAWLPLGDYKAGII